MTIKTLGNEYPQHTRAKERLFAILTNKGLVCDFEIRTGVTETALGDRNYTADIFAFWPDIRSGTAEKIIFEVDGQYHNSKRQLSKMELRDKAHLQKGIRTVRLRTSWLVGKGKVDDDDIWQEIEWQLAENLK